MKQLSQMETALVAGGERGSLEGYQSNTMLWSIVGICSGVYNASKIVPYGDFFIVQFAVGAACGVAGYAFGAVEYHVVNALHDATDYLLAPSAEVSA